MDNTEIIITLFNITAICGCAIWISMYLLGAWTVLNARKLENTSVKDSGQDRPLVSVVFAARDEEAEIGDALTALARTDYPNMEVIAVNDRSTDSTGNIIDQHSARDPRIKGVHIDNLPPGWLGKVHALDRGYRESSGQWVIFTDADVKLLPDTITKAVTMAQEGRHDHFVLFPKLTGSSYMLEIVFVAFSVMFLMGTKAYTIGRKNSKGFIGVGAFNMVRRDAFDRTPGFEWLRMEVGDDVGLGLMMKNSGASTGYAFAGMGVHLVWYENLPQMFRGLSKNMFSTARYSYLRLIPMTSFLLILGLSPLAALAPWAWPALTGMTAACFISTVILGLASNKLFVQRLSPYIFGPAGFILLPVIFINSALHCYKKGGVEWRGTLYSIDELKKGQRLKL